MPPYVRINELLAEESVTASNLRETMLQEYESLDAGLEVHLDSAEGYLRLHQRRSMAWDQAVSFDPADQASTVGSQSRASSPTLSFGNASSHLARLELPPAGTLLAAGWFTKQPGKRGKARLRFFEARDGQVQYYGDVKEGYGVGLKGSFAVHPLAEFDADAAMLTIRNPERSYCLVCDSSAQIKTWLTALAMARRQSAVAVPVTADARRTREEELVVGLDGGVLLRKYGEGLGALQAKPRLFVAVFGVVTRRLKLNYYDTSSGSSVQELKGSIELDSNASISSDGDDIAIVRLQVACSRILVHVALQETASRKWRLTAPSAAVAALATQQWCQLCQDLSENAAGDRPKVDIALLLYQHLADATLELELEDLLADLARQLLPRAMVASQDMFEAGYLLMRLIKSASQRLWQGFLKKRVGGLSSDHRRFFEVRGRTMYYFQGENNGNGCLLKGAISLVEAEFSRPEPKQFGIHTPDRDYVLESDELEPAERLDGVLNSLCARRQIASAPAKASLVDAAMEVGNLQEAADEEPAEAAMVVDSASPVAVELDDASPELGNASPELDNASPAAVEPEVGTLAVHEPTTSSESRPNSRTESVGSDITQLAADDAVKVRACLHASMGNLTCSLCS